ncbi:MAG: GNAT family acetyltransferase [Myxococcota bacterium]|nr:GNAT family acetyltransferase [Myxococcota bacterium]
MRPFRSADREAVIALWELCGLARASNDPGRDIERKQDVQPDLFLVGFDGDVLVATVMAGYEGHRGWVNYLGVDPHHRRKGYGRVMMHAAEEALAGLGAPKVNLQVRSGNDEAVAFYRDLGYEIEERVSLGKRLGSA